MNMKMIENPIVLNDPHEEEENPLEYCDICERPLFHGDTVYKIEDTYYCTDCVEACELDYANYVPDEPDYDCYRDNLIDEIDYDFLDDED